MERGARQGSSEGEPEIGMEKVILTLIWRIKGFHVVDMMPATGCFNTKYCFIHMMDSLLAQFPNGKKSHALRLSVCLDNCRVHSSNASK
jgi:hypothetical protein